MNNQRTLKSSPTHIYRAIFAIKTLPLGQQLRVTDLGHPDVFDDLESLRLVEGNGIGGTLVDWIPAHPLLLDDLRRLVSIFHLQNALPGTTNSVNRTTIALTAFPGDLTEYCLTLLVHLGWAIQMGCTWQLTEVGRTLATEFLVGANFVWPDAASRNATPTLLDTLLLLPYAGAPAHVIHQCYKSAAPIVYTIASLDELVKKGFVVRDKALTHTLTAAGKTKALEEYPIPPLAFPILTTPHKSRAEDDWRVLEVFVDSVALRLGMFTPLAFKAHTAAIRAPGSMDEATTRIINLTERGYLKDDKGVYSLTDLGEEALRSWLNYRGILKTPSDASSPSTPAQSTPMPEKPVSDELAKNMRRLTGRVGRLESEVEQIKKDVVTPSVCIDPWTALHTTPGARVRDYLTKSLESNPSLSDHWITPAEVVARLYAADNVKPSIDQVLASAKCHPSLRVFDDPKYPNVTLIALKNPRPAQYADQFGNAVRISGLAGEKPSPRKDILSAVNKVLWKELHGEYSRCLALSSRQFYGCGKAYVPISRLNSEIGRPPALEGELAMLLKSNSYSFTPGNHRVSFAQFKGQIEIENHITWCVNKMFDKAGRWMLELEDVTSEVGVSKEVLLSVMKKNLLPQYRFEEAGAVALDGKTTPMLQRRVVGEHPKPSDSPNQEGKWVCAADQKEVEKKILALLKSQYVNALVAAEQRGEAWDNREVRVSVASLASQTGVDVKSILQAIDSCKAIRWWSAPTGYQTSLENFRPEQGFAGFHGVPTLGDIRHWIADQAYAELKKHGANNYTLPFDGLAVALRMPGDTLKVSVKGDDRFFEWYRHVGSLVTSVIGLVAPPVNTAPKPTRQRSLVEKVVGWLKANTTGDKPFHSAMDVAFGVCGSNIGDEPSSILHILEKAARARNGVQVRVVGLDGRQTVEWTWGPALAAHRKQTRDVRRGAAYLLSAYPDEWFSVAEIADKTKYSEVQIERALNLRRHDFPVTTIAGDKTKPTLYKWHLSTHGGGK